MPEETVTPPTTNSADIAGNAMRAMEAAEAPAASAPPEPASAPAPQSAPEQPEYTGLRDYAKEMGVELPFEDDRAAFQNLLTGWQKAQQAEPYQPYIAEYLQHKQDFDRWKQEQARAQVQKPEPLWNPPASEQEVTALMQHYYQRDADGTVKAKPDCPMDVRQKVEGYGRYIEQFQTKFTRDPMGTLQPFIQQAVQPLLSQQQEQLREDYEAKRVLAEHSQWLYEPGTQKLTPTGEIYKSFLGELEKDGVKGVKNLDKYARDLTMLSLFQQKYADEKKAEAAKPAEAPEKPRSRNERFSQNNNRRPSVGSAVANGQAPPVDRKGMGLGEQMRAALRAAGVDAGKEEAAELGLAN